jgi:hypothetical protein
MLRRIPQGILGEPGQIRKHLDEFETDLVRLIKKLQKITVELRLAPDKLNHAATKCIRLIHDRLVVFRCQQVALTAAGT